MTPEQQLQAIRERWRELEGAYPSRVHLDITALLRMVEERDAIIHDLQLDHRASTEAGRSEGINAILDTIRGFRARCLKAESEQVGLSERDRNLGRIQAANILLESILALAGLPDGGRADPLPPDQARAECERLRAKLRKIREQIGIFLDVFTHYQEQWPGLEPAMKTLSRMASEDTP